MSHDRLRRGLAGISGVHVTPFDEAGRVDRPTLIRVIDRIAAAGIHNIVSGGNTGEFYALTEDEVIETCRVAVEVTAGRALVTAGVGRSLIVATKLAKAAASAGADAIMVHQPPDPFAAPRGIVEYLRALAEATALPVVGYIRTEALGPKEYETLAQVPNFVGVKYASQNLQHLADCMRATEGSPIVWVCGLAEGWAPTFYATGARGFTSGLVNVYPQRSLEILGHLDAGRFDAARALIETVVPFEIMRAAEKNGTNVTVVKEAMALIGEPVGSVRLPGAPRLGSAERTQLAAVLRSWGFEPTQRQTA